MLLEICKREHYHCFCLQETHRPPHLVIPMITGRHSKLSDPTSSMVALISSEVKSVCVREQDNVELISIELPGVVVHSVYKPQKEKFVLPALGHGNLPNIVI